MTDPKHAASNQRKATLRERLAALEETVERQERIIRFYQAENKELSSRIRDLMRPSPLTHERDV